MEKMRTPTSKNIFIGKKKLEYYSNLLIRADKGLHEQVVKILERKVGKGSTVLDMGAGQGALSARLNDLGYMVTAVDVDDNDYAIHGSNIRFEHVNFDEEENLVRFSEKNESSFDVVCGVEVIEHLENPWSYIRGLIKLVRKGGLVLVTTPNVTSWLSRLCFLRTGLFLSFQKENLSYGHINPISSFELNLIMSRCGLKNIEIESAGTLPPIYVTSFKMGLYSALALLLRPFQSGLLNGWCVIATGEK